MALFVSVILLAWVGQGMPHMHGQKSFVVPVFVRCLSFWAYWSGINIVCFTYGISFLYPQQRRVVGWQTEEVDKTNDTKSDSFPPSGHDSQDNSE